MYLLQLIAQEIINIIKQLNNLINVFNNVYSIQLVKDSKHVQISVLILILIEL